MASSVIRILPKKKVARSVVPYAALLGRVLTKRSLQALLVVGLGVALVSPLLAYVAAPCSSKRVMLALFLSALPVFLRTKLLLATESTVETSAAWQTWYVLFSRRFLLTLVLLTMSALIYAKLLLSNAVPLATLQKAAFDKHPSGIPASLALHQTDQWYLVHQSYLFITGFSIFAAIAGAIVESLYYVLDADPCEVGKKPLNRIRHRFWRLKRSLVLGAVLQAVWPVIYFSGGRRVLFALFTARLQRWPTRELDQFEWSVLLGLPVRVLPLLLLWQFTREVYMAYLTLGPVHHHRPISELSPLNADGALLQGVSQPAHTLVAKFAWNELLFIAEHEPARRKQLFGESDGEQVMWDQFCAAFEQLLTAQITKLVDPPKPEPKPTNSPPKPADSVVFGSTDDILTGRTPPKVSRPAEEPVVTVRRAKTGEKPIFKPETALEKRLAQLNAHLVTSDTPKPQEFSFLTTFGAVISRQRDVIASTKIGRVFLPTAERRLAQKICNRQTTVFAMRAMARMVTQSLTEDANGFVQSTVAQILAKLDEYALALEKLRLTSSATGKPDEKASKSAVPKLPLVESMLAQANSAFLEIAQVMSPYYPNLGVSESVARRTRAVLNGEYALAETAWLPYAYAT